MTEPFESDRIRERREVLEADIANFDRHIDLLQEQAPRPGRAQSLANYATKLREQLDDLADTALENRQREALVLAELDFGT